MEDRSLATPATGMRWKDRSLATPATGDANSVPPPVLFALTVRAEERGPLRLDDPPDLGLPARGARLVRPSVHAMAILVTPRLVQCRPVRAIAQRRAFVADRLQEDFVHRRVQPLGLPDGQSIAACFGMDSGHVQDLRCVQIPDSGQDSLIQQRDFDGDGACHAVARGMTLPPIPRRRGPGDPHPAAVEPVPGSATGRSPNRVDPRTGAAAGTGRPTASPIADAPRPEDRPAGAGPSSGVRRPGRCRPPTAARSVFPSGRRPRWFVRARPQRFAAARGPWPAADSRNPTSGGSGSDGRRRTGCLGTSFRPRAIRAWQGLAELDGGSGFCLAPTMRRCR